MEDNVVENSHNFNKVKQLVLTALLFAMAIVIAIVENTLPSLPAPVPGVKLGLSNIVVMYALFFLGGKKAYAIAVLKALFVFITRGLVAGILSFTGGVLSLTIMLLLILIFKDKVSYLIISISGAVFHNLGQFVAVSIIYTNLFMWPYIPILLISGVITGVLTATLLRLIMPAFKKLGLR
jgi:heptaprenyl diphosphate synthase